MKLFSLYSALGFPQVCVVSMRRGFSFLGFSEHTVFHKLYFTLKTENSTLIIWSTKSAEPILPANRAHSSTIWNSVGLYSHTRLSAIKVILTIRNS